MFFPYLLAALLCATRPARQVPVPARLVVDAGHLDESQSFDLLIAITGGGGRDGRAPHGATEYGGFKIGTDCCVRGTHPTERGDTVTLDIGWDRLRSRHALSLEMSLMIAAVRFPRPIANQSRRFVRVYLEPGAGIRAGGGSSAYFSAKTMIAFMSDKQIWKFAEGPIVEIQHRFPFRELTRGDTRILFGIMAPLCRHCGFD